MKITEIPIILASGSARRSEILHDAGASFAVFSPGCEEDIHLPLTPEEYVMALSLRKNLAAENELKLMAEGKMQEPEAKDGCPRVLSLYENEHLLITGDTVVYKDGEIIGKPKDFDDAFRILGELNGGVNTVCSGVCLKLKSKSERIVFSDSTKVYFKHYTDDFIREYIKEEEPYDKAGAYAIQGPFKDQIDRIEGSLLNVIGFPLEKLEYILSKNFK